LSRFDGLNLLVFKDLVDENFFPAAWAAGLGQKHELPMR
jgi:hypothetical protein